MKETEDFPRGDIKQNARGIGMGLIVKKKHLLGADGSLDLISDQHKSGLVSFL